MFAVENTVIINGGQRAKLQARRSPKRLSDRWAAQLRARLLTEKERAWLLRQLAKVR